MVFAIYLPRWPRGWRGFFAFHGLGGRSLKRSAYLRLASILSPAFDPSGILQKEGSASSSSPRRKACSANDPGLSTAPRLAISISCRTATLRATSSAHVSSALTATASAPGKALVSAPLDAGEDLAPP